MANLKKGCPPLVKTVCNSNMATTPQQSDPGIGGRLILRTWTGLIWLRIRTGGGHL